MIKIPSISFILILFLFSSKLYTKSSDWMKADRLPTKLQNKVKLNLSYNGEAKFRNLKFKGIQFYCGEIKLSNNENYLKFYVASNTVHTEKTEWDSNLIDNVCEYVEIENEFKFTDTVEQMGKWKTILNGPNSNKYKTWVAVNEELFPESQNPVRIFFSCEDEKPDISISFPESKKITGKNVYLKYQLDKGEVIKEQWKNKRFLNSVSRKSNTKNNVKLISMMENATLLKISFPKEFKQPYSAYFELNGFNRIRNLIKNSCPGKNKYWR